MNTEVVNHCPKCQAPVPPEAPQGLCPKCLLASVSTATEAGQSAEGQAPPSLEAVAAVFPHLEILEFIGQGGMGFVYKARQPKLDRCVALKLLQQKPGSDPSFNERFHREARVLARLSHPNIVAVHDFGQAANFFYLLMEFVDGVNLRQAMRAGRFTSAQALALVPKICDALQYAHEEGVLHRDIKPENILLDTRGRLKIADFGIAKILGDRKDITLTGHNAAVGTPHYMAPEQLERPHEVDQRADVYSVGVVFYEMLTGELPLGRFAPPSEKAAVDARVDPVVMRALEKERERRFQSAGEVKTEVENITANPGAVPKQGTSAAPNSASVIPPGTAYSGTPAAEGKKWSRRALASGALVGISLLLLLPVLLVGGHLHEHEAMVLALFLAAPALSGTLLGWRAIRNPSTAGGQLRGRRLALLATAAWPLLFLNVGIFAGLVAFMRSFEHDLLHFQFPGLTIFVGVTALLGLLGFSAVLLRHWLKPGGHEQALIPKLDLGDAAARIPRLALWLLAVGLLGSLLILSLAGARSRFRNEANPVVQIDEPVPPEGYEVPGATFMGNERMFRSAVSIPAGYVLTVAATVCSNQVVLRSSQPGPSAFIIAPPGQNIHGTLTWHLLGNTTLGDGAPLEFSLGPDGESENRRKSFHMVPPEPLLVDWAGEPRQIWPPLNGHTRYILLKGAKAPVAPDTQIPGEAPVQWSVGIETRLDPIPERFLQNLQQVVVGVDADWRSTFETSPATTPADPETDSPADPQ
jgi:tRNA A-37 threonylcarbamoyl transferase component Bud32